MNLLIDGQLDALTLLEPVPPVTDPTGPSIPDLPLTCPACGQTSPNAYVANLDHWIHPADSHQFGRPVCISMNLTRNHIIYWTKVLAGDYEPPDKMCCHGAIKTHKGRATRANYIDHIRQDIDNAIEYWDDMTWLTPLMDSAGVTLDELDENEWGANCHRHGCHWATRWSGYATRDEAMQALKHHEKESHDTQQSNPAPARHGRPSSVL